jgi:hypothetical protein
MIVLFKINYGQIGNQTWLFYTTNPVFYTSGNRFVRRTSTFGNLTYKEFERGILEFFAFSDDDNL